MSRGPRVTQAEFDYLKQLQKRKVGHIEAAIQTGRPVRTVRTIFSVEQLSEYQDKTRFEKKPKQQALLINVQPHRTSAEMQQAIQNLSDLYWQLRDRIEKLEKQANAWRLARAPASQIENLVKANEQANKKWWR